MNLKKQLFIAFLLSFVSLLSFSFMAALVNKHKLIHFDQNIIQYVQGFESPKLTAMMKLFSLIGGTMAVMVISLLAIFILYIAFKHRSELVLFIAVMVGANFLFLSLKQVFHRARPDLHRLAEASNYSFPSGHATMAFALYGALTFLLWRHISSQIGRVLLIILSAFMILTIGISRIYLGVHYPSDIMGGYFISAFWLTFAIGFYQRYKERQYKRKLAS
ncbi:PAP2 family protein [Neobacillus notoginsengisoli]|uniref:PAP2 family protein n=2 Tax=Neobacillus notoginsengisoli TaxID=1578198 RepID=A0A417Z076_9BACI|nr:PAP2 family protein [Neobacillus notoginsengisoli]